MNTAPFYELHDRLYDCASAGCASIPEDFRLKRAVEGMAPLAEANKTFARLRDMCARLFTEPEPALLLADCIALADALAVAQGHYTNAEESQPGTLEYDVEYNMEAGWRSVKSLWAAILTKSQHLKKLDPDEYALLGDPRILEMFISASGEKGENISAFADTMCAAYGTSIVPLLKGSIDMSDEKASGVQVDYIANTAGSSGKRLVPLPRGKRGSSTECPDKGDPGTGTGQRKRSAPAGFLPHRKGQGKNRRPP